MLVVPCTGVTRLGGPYRGVTTVGVGRVSAAGTGVALPFELPGVGDQGDQGEGGDAR